MDINTFLSIAVIGAALSLLQQWLKDKMGLSDFGNKASVILASVVVGGAYFFLSGTIWWADIIGVLASASTVYALFLKSPSA